jgi:hypothetical protein
LLSANYFRVPPTPLTRFRTRRFPRFVEPHSTGGDQPLGLATHGSPAFSAEIRSPYPATISDRQLISPTRSRATTRLPPFAAPPSASPTTLTDYRNASPAERGHVANAPRCQHSSSPPGAPPSPPGAPPSPPVRVRPSPGPPLPPPYRTGDWRLPSYKTRRFLPSPTRSRRLAFRQTDASGLTEPGAGVWPLPKPMPAALPNRGRRLDFPARRRCPRIHRPNRLDRASRPTTVAVVKGHTVKPTSGSQWALSVFSFKPSVNADSYPFGKIGAAERPGTRSSKPHRSRSRGASKPT